MSDFSELENELKKLRPVQPSPILLERIEEAMADAVLLLLAKINTDRGQEPAERIAQISPAPETKSLLPAHRGANGIDGSRSPNEFIPARATQLVYNTRDEGLQFTDAAEQPVRRLRYQMRETWQWRNPATGASLRVSYPSEEVVLIPVSGQ